MKNIIFLLFLGFLMPLMAQKEPKEPLETKMFFPSREVGEKAFSSGNFRYYIPNPDNLKAKPPRLAKGLPCTYIVLEEVRENKGKSPAWVLLPPGTPAEFNSSGVPIIDGRCWNKILEAYPIQERYIPLSELSKLQGPPGKDGHTPVKGIDYFDGKDGRNGIDGRGWGWEEEGKSSFWTDWGAPIIGGVLTGIGTGFAFPEENETVIQTITPGTKVQTANGIFVYGPEKIKTDTRIEKKFSWKNAGIGFVAGTLTLKIALN